MSILEAFKLNGKTALVTGCNDGIGHALATGLAETGADIVGVSCYLADTGPAAADVRALGSKFSAYECDFSNREALFAFIRQVHADHPEIDILMNNAGLILRSPAAEFPDEYWDRVIQVNLDAQFFLAREFGRRMVERGRGKIVFIASMLSFQGGLNVPSYAAANGAIPQLAMALSNEWSSQGVSVNCIAPGYIRTEVTAALQADPVRNPQILSRIPSGRWGETDDLQGAAVFLASSVSDCVTCITLPVDGGWLGR